MVVDKNLKGYFILFFFIKMFFSDFNHCTFNIQNIIIRNFTFSPFDSRNEFLIFLFEELYFFSKAVNLEYWVVIMFSELGELS